VSWKLRLRVDAGGCGGWQYEFDVVDEQADDDDMVFGRDGVQVLVDDTSFDFVSGATIDYEQTLASSSFRVVNNPNVQMACGCGSSFELKEDA
jgi:iron-sulfur cluster insertion protein